MFSGRNMGPVFLNVCWKVLKRVGRAIDGDHLENHQSNHTAKGSEEHGDHFFFAIPFGCSHFLMLF